MARSYSIQSSAAVGSASYHQLAIYMATAAGVRPKINEIAISCSATPNDYSSRFLIARSTSAAPTGGSTPTTGSLDMADHAALASAYALATGGETMSTILYQVSVNLRATFRFVAAPTKEFTVPNSQYAGCGIQVVGQSTTYAIDLNLQWEE
jgi:hypothetical protein